MRTHFRSLLPAAAVLALCFASCWGGGSTLNKRQSSSAGEFKVLSINMENGDTWALNRPIVIQFNHPVDVNSVSFSSIIIRPTDPAILGRPVTGTFQIDPADNRIVIFRPTCPTDPASSNGAFFPGGFTYEIAIPTRDSFGTSVLRDIAGHSITVGLTRSFRTPIPPTEPLFIDTVTGPPVLSTPVVFPVGLNLFSDPDPIFEIQFNQPINGASTNLNTSRVFVLYSTDEVGGALANEFLATSKVPGQLFLVDNCAAGGALVYFQATGVLPANRNLKVVISTDFEDLSGETNAVPVESAVHAVPDLATYYGDGIIVQADETVDEFSDFFATSNLIDASASLAVPQADVNVGRVSASFDFPGQLVSQDEDMVLKDNQVREVWTDGSFSFTDSNGRAFTVIDGVLNVDDFTIEAGSTLRGRGGNPLVIYANGTVTVEGTLDVSGNHARTPIALNAPHIPEPGAVGECGGGLGGSASLTTTAETVRAGSGVGAFSQGSGGGGAEGSITWVDGAGGWNDLLETWISGGGAGGTFANGPNAAVVWDRWAGVANPPDFDDAGPDVRSDRHTVFNTASNIELYFVGGEDGIRGNSWGAQALELPNLASPPEPYGGYGMEDVNRDTGNTGTLDDSTAGLDPAWTSGPVTDPPPFDFGHPTNGPDQGLTNASPFTGLAADDFWGRRVNAATGATVDGELLAPWAGAGGGASGDSQIVIRVDADGDSFLDPLGNFYPDPSFPTGTTVTYWKGAPGGGGGGQLQVMAIGPIILGPLTRISANGGIGNGGESTFSTDQQVSGSGGGSGGHVVLHSATGLDLSAIDVGDPFGVFTESEIIQAIGGRRGWVASVLGEDLPSGDNDGNSDFMIGRGGAGSNGVIQIHVPDPATDISWHPSDSAAIVNYITNGGGPVDADRVEEMLGQHSAPTPFALVPMYAAKSQFQSVWIDTGLADEHLPGGTYPDYASSQLSLEGIDTLTGMVESTGGMVDPGTQIATGVISGAGATVADHQVTIRNVNPDGSNLFGTQATGQMILRNPGLLAGYDFLPDSLGASSFEITSATYNRVSRVLTITTSPGDGAMSFAINPGNLVWSIQQKFFRVSTTGQKDRLPADASVMLEFQGADESSPGTGIPGTPTAWLTDLDHVDLEGKRFIRYRATFDMDAQAAGVTLNSERPALEYVKIPFGW